MSIFEKLERRIGWISFPGFLRYYALFHVLVFVLLFIRPDIGSLLAFDREKILHGEVWRLATHFFAVSIMGSPSLMSIIFLVFAVNFAFMISDGLEGSWGVFKTTLFYLVGIVLTTLVSFIYSGNIAMGGFVLYGSAFLALATLQPKTEIMVMLVLPVQLRILAMLLGVVILLNLIAVPTLFPYILLGLVNFIGFAAIPALRGTARSVQSGQRRKQFQAGKKSAAEAFHTCVVCQRTEISDPQLEFRTGEDGRDCCTEHLPPSRG